MLSTSGFNGINKPIQSAVFSVIKIIVLYVPLAWLGSKVFGINGLFAGLNANVAMGAFSFKYLFGSVRKLMQANDDDSPKI